jgi:mono/diheme cytochrome c family protein
MLRVPALLAVLALAGCGTGGLADENATVGKGREVFIEKCQSCHTLADAGTRGIIGPNLDDAFAVSLEEGFDESTVVEVVLGQMRFPIPPMPEPEVLFPPGEYTDAEREEVMEAIAVYVASVAGRPPTQTQTAGETGDASDPKALFTSNCASCHVFADAGSTGTIGPNLDQSSLDVAAIEEQIRTGGGGMPPFEGSLTDEQIAALAKYLAENRG